MRRRYVTCIRRSAFDWPEQTEGYPKEKAPEGAVLLPGREGVISLQPGLRYPDSLQPQPAWAY